MVKELLKWKANIDAPSEVSGIFVHEIYFLLIFFFFFFSFLKDGATPLFISSAHGHVEVVKELIKGKANIDAPWEVSGIFIFVL